MADVPWWGRVSAAAAPALLIGGWTLAASLRDGFDAVSQTISALAASGAEHRWVMTSALFGVGAAHLTTALALRPAALPGRLLVALGGAGTLLVAAFPLPADGGPAPEHAAAALLAFGSLSLWPAASWRRGVRVPLGLRPVVATGAAVVLAGLLAWFGTEFVRDGGAVGLAERAAAGSQALWPLAVVLTARPGGRRR